MSEARGRKGFVLFDAITANPNLRSLQKRKGVAYSHVPELLSRANPTQPYNVKMSYLFLHHGVNQLIICKRRT